MREAGSTNACETFPDTFCAGAPAWRWLAIILGFVLTSTNLMAEEYLLIHDPQQQESTSMDAAEDAAAQWRLITDGVMGGKSLGSLTKDVIEGRPCSRLRGEVSLRNFGGFIQMAQDITEPMAAKAADYDGIFLDVYGNNETYGVHLRSKDNWLPWQAYRASFVAEPAWQVIHLPFDRFKAYRTSKPLDLSRLARIGIVAIGREFTPDLCVGRVGFYTAKRPTS